MTKQSNTDIRVVPEEITIIDTQVSVCNVNTPVGFSLDKVQGHIQDLTFDLASKLDESLIKTEIELNVSTEGENEKQATGIFHFVFIFHVENLKRFFKQASNDTDKALLHAGLGNAISSITYSTSRGILLVRLQGTGLGGFVLPVIDPSKLFKA